MSHTGEHASFIEAKAAFVGLKALVETGPPSGFPDQPGLVDELNDAVKRTGVVAAGAYTHGDTVADPNDTVGEVPGAPLSAPDGAIEFVTKPRPGDRFSFASMFGPSSDLFLAPGAEGIALWPTGGKPVEGDMTEVIQL